MTWRYVTRNFSPTTYPDLWPTQVRVEVERTIHDDGGEIEADLDLEAALRDKVEKDDTSDIDEYPNSLALTDMDGVPPTKNSNLPLDYL